MRFLALSALALSLAALAQASFFSFGKASEAEQLRSEWQKKAFAQPGHEYRFQYDAQLSAGYAAWISAQKAQQRLQADVRVNFASERSAVLRIAEARLGQQNGEMDATDMQSMKLSRRAELPAEQEKQLQMPVEFTMADGKVERILFNKEDPVWSRNIKKAIINLMQLNVQKASFAPEQPNGSDKTEKAPRVYTETETTLEGECPVLYTIAATGPQQWNVTKSVQFEQCQKLVDTAYGFQTEQTEQQLRQQQQEQPQGAKQAEQQQGEQQQPIPQQKLQRSTVYRFQLRADKDGKKIALLNSEVVADYQLKSTNAEAPNAQQILALASLKLRSVEPKKAEKPAQKLDQEESLLYNAKADSDAKRFFMYGDDEFTKNPFDQQEETEQTRAQLIKKSLRQVADAFQKQPHESKQEVISQVTEAMWAVRRCSQKTLKSILAEQKSTVERELFEDMLALAATYNPVAVLAQHMPKMSTVQAVKTLKSISGNMIAPSERIAQQVLDLCKKIGSKDEQVKQQSCWLAFSAIVGQVQQQQHQAQRSADYPTKQEEQQVESKLQQFQKTLEQKLEDASEEYEKVVALKALANAGLPKSIPTIEEIIKDRKQSAFVRTEAIDSLRRMRFQEPQKLQEILMPIFVNNKEKSEPRMAALSLIASTLAAAPAKPVVDQIVYTLLNERSEQVRAFTYSLCRAYAQSPVPAEQEAAQQMQQALQLAGADEEEQLQRASRAVRVPIYSRTEQEGLILGATLAFSPESLLPTHVAAYVDNMLNGLVNKHSLYVSVCQQNADKWIQRLAQQARQAGVRSSKNRKGTEEMKKILAGIKVQKRQGSTETPFAMISLRVKDVDQAIIPLTDRTFTQLVENYRNAKSLAAFFQVDEQAKGEFNSLISAHETAITIPTVTGHRIQAQQLTIALAQGAAKVSGNLDLEKHIKAHVEVERAQFAVQHQQTLRVFDAVNGKHIGVASQRALEVQTPKQLSIRAMASYEKGLQVEASAAQHKIRLAEIRSLPFTFVGKQQIRAVQNRQLQQLQREIRYAGQTLRVSGVVHQPTSWEQPSEVLKTVLAAENHILVEYTPSRQLSESVTFKLQAAAFQPAELEETQSEGLKQFYKQQRQITRQHAEWDGEEEKNAEDDEFDAAEQKKANDFMAAYGKRIHSAGSGSSKAYKHQLKATVQSGEQKAQCELVAICDASLTACRLQLSARRPAIAAMGEQKEWKLKASADTLMPEQMEQQKHSQLLAHLKAQWGAEMEQQVEARLSAKPQPRFPKEVALFLNQFDLSADYKLSRGSQQTVERAYQLFKAYYYMQAELRTSPKDQSSGSRTQGHIRARLAVEPFTRKAFNLTIQTADELLHLENVPSAAKLGLRVQKQQRRPAFHSVQAMIGRAAEQGRQECRVQKNNVIQTFDDAEYRAPLSQRCFSVLAKDCQNVDEPQFVVMAKQQTEQKGNGNKIVKIVTPEHTLEAEPKTGAKDEAELKLRWNGEQVKPFELPQENVEYDGEQLYVRFAGVSVRFDGRKLSVKVAPEFSNAQCGLCGQMNVDDDSLRTAGDEETEDVAEFHRSYNVRDAQCTEAHEKQFYGDEEQRQTRFRQLRDFSAGSSEQSEEQMSSWESAEQAERSAEQQEDEEEEAFDYESGKPKTVAPKSKIQVHEYKHKLCFSKTPVARCQAPAYAEEEQQKEEQRDFACFERHSSEARQLQREVRRAGQHQSLKQLADRLGIQLNKAFVQNVMVDTQCRRDVRAF